MKIHIRHIMSVLTSRTRHMVTTLMAVGMLLASVSCNSVDDKRIPDMPVQIVFTDVGMWNMYGVNGALQHKRFFRTQSASYPAGFFYTAATYTGFGGVLLVGDVMGDAKAFDLACPYERQADIRVSINPETNYAECPKCHSEYDVFENNGLPVSGPSAEHGYSLRKYGVFSSGTNYRVITN